MSFEFKYLKYKNKYLKLKNLLGGAPNDDVYILIDKGDPSRFVSMPARDYQKEALNNYIDTNKVGEFEYTFGDGTITFSIKPYKTAELYIFTRDNGTSNLISRNNEKLIAMGAYYNRLNDF
jgi:hypothetical protein